jgi:zinc transport system substrate-binding protein
MVLMWIRRVAVAAVLVPLAPLLAACAGPTGGDVVASFYPLQFVAERVVGGHLSVSGLTAPGVEPHDLELTPRQRAGVDAAQVVVYEKGLQPAVDEAVRASGVEHVVDAADVVPLRSVDQHASEDHAGDLSEHGHDGGEPDPHFWLDPTLLAQVAEAVGKEVAAADPDHAADYRHNTAALVADLHRLDREFRTGLAQCRIHTLVVSHDAFGYLGDRYGLEIVPIAGLSPGAEPSPKRLAELQRVAREKGVTTIFSEELASPALAQTLAGDLGLRTAVLSPVEGLTKAGSADYLSVMRDNLAAIRKANDCS